MNLQIRIKNSDGEDVINKENVDNINSFSFVDSFNALNTITILEDGMMIKRVADTHKTNLVLRKDKRSFINIESKEGNLNFDTKVLAFDKNNDIITIVYLLGESENYITIKNVGV